MKLRWLIPLLLWSLTANAAYTFRAASAYVHTQSGATLTPAMCAGWQPGDLGIIESDNFSNGDLITTAPTGWTLISPNSGTTHVVAYGRVLQTGDTAQNISWGAGVSDAIMICFSGSVPSTLTGIVDTSHDQGSTATNVLKFPSLTTPGNANDLVIGFSQFNKTSTSNGATIGTLASFTKAADLVTSGTSTAVTSQYWIQTTATGISSTSVSYSITDATGETNSFFIALKAASTTPTYTSAPALGTLTATTIPVAATVDTTSTEYGVAIAVGAAAPTCAQIIAGTNGSGVAAAYTATAAMTATVPATLTFTGVASSPYDLYFCSQAAGQNSVVKTIAAAYKLPAYTVAPVIGTPGASTLSATATPDTTSTEYGVAVAHGDTAPTCANIVAGHNHAGTAALNAANTALTAAVSGTLTFTSVVTNPVDLYFCLNDTGGNSGVSSLLNAAISSTWTITPNVASTATGGYTIGFTAAGAGTVYCEAIAQGATAPSSAQVHAGHDSAGAAALATVNKVVTTAADSVVLTGLTFPTHDLYCVFNGGSDSAIASMINAFKTPPTGKQYQALTSVSATSPCNQVTGTTVSAGDTLVVDAVTTPSSFPITTVNGCDLWYPGDLSRQEAIYDVYHVASAAFLGGGTAGQIWFNDSPPNGTPDFTVGLTQGNAASVDFSTLMSNAEADTLTFTSSSTGTGTGVNKIPAGMTQSGKIWSGTPTTAGSGSFTETATDAAGATGTSTVTWQVVTTESTPDCVSSPTNASACTALYNADFIIYSLAYACSHTVTAGQIVSQVPPAGTSVAPFSGALILESAGNCGHGIFFRGGPSLERYVH